MVTRKPVPYSGLAPTANPPYPTTPIAADSPAPYPTQDARYQMQSDDSGVNSEDAWSQEGISKHNTGIEERLPDSLRAGPPAGYTPKSSQERLAPVASNTNPFLKKQNTGSSNGGDSSADIWGASVPPTSVPPPPPTNAPPPPPIPQGIKQLLVMLGESANKRAEIENFSNLSVNEPSGNPWQPHLDQRPPSETPSALSIRREDSGQDAWAASAPGREPPSLRADTSQPVLIDLEGPESPAWDEDEPSPIVPEIPADEAPEVQQIDEGRDVWDQAEIHARKQGQSSQQMPTQEQDGWNLVDHEPRLVEEQVGQQHGGIIAPDGEVLQRFESEKSPPDLPPRRPSQEFQPELPPRPSQEYAPPQPPRPIIDADRNRSTSSLMSGGTYTRRQKKETYEIKKITWHDVNAANNPRISPILVQNANGPCPLLALVNALTLSTPADVETALVETLRSREQVSLGLLLDAVFDELMSGRRGDAAHELPDVSDLYSFLITLHTGMNVNPCFFPPPPTKLANDPRNSMSHVHPSEREGSIPGTFEETREMRLYSTFSVPLIHGWLPEADSPAYMALKRTAQSYEDAQNMFFHEEELEDKLRREGLSFEEQSTLEDIATIKAFFASNATQLTSHGLNTITTSIAPGAVAILFRNDHFSTLYRHPNTMQLLQLVTDMGYAGHEEVVWESLIDVNGENAEFFSGDFRLVGGAPAPTSVSEQGTTDGWAPLQVGTRGQQSSGHRATASSSSYQSNVSPPPQSPTTEQEDHDLALALQLQEEEEERHRTEIARRQRETELSQQYIEQQGQARNQNNNIPVSQRGGGRGQGAAGRGAGPVRGGGAPAIPPRRSGPGQQADPEAGVDVPPPTYEQAANQAAYVPPANHPAHPNASPNGAPAVPGRRMSAYSQNAQGYQGQNTPPGRISRRGTGPTLIEQIPGRRNTSSGGGSGQQQGQTGERERDCIVM